MLQRLRNQSQHYAWGKTATDSLVCAFIDLVDQSLPYAELWVGTSPLMESYVGQRRLSEVTGALPYLLKVLSIGKPLSIQVHPNKAQAQRLHTAKPELYPDANHKPEVCVALTAMQLLYGLKTEAEVRLTLAAVPELAQLLSEEKTIKGKILRLFENESETRRLVLQCVQRTATNSDPSSHLIQLLHHHFPSDVGVFFALLMNLIELEPGEGLFIPPGTPHSYLSGDCVEAQACSDNVARCGLTPKPKDLDTLLDILSYDHIGRPHILRPDRTASSYLFDVSCEDFALYRVQSDGMVTCPGPTCLLVVEGEGCLVQTNTQQGIRKGDSFLLTSDARVTGTAVVFACTPGLAIHSS